MIDRRNNLLVKEYLGWKKGSVSDRSLTRIWFFLRHLLLWADELYLGKLEIVKGDSFQTYLSIVKTQKGLLSLESKKKILDYSRDFTSAVYLYLSGQRAGAYVTTPINAIDLSKNEIFQWPDVYGVKTKNQKKATTFLYQIPGLIGVVRDWDAYIRSVIPEEEWNTYPWCAQFNNKWGEKTIVLQPSGAKSRGANLIKRFNKLFLNLELEYKNPHAFRHGHAVFGLSHARTPAGLHAVSKNLIHDNSVITEKIYAGLELNDRKRIISNLHSSPICQPDDALLSILKPLSHNDLLRVIRLSADLMTN